MRCIPGVELGGCRWVINGTGSSRSDYVIVLPSNLRLICWITQHLLYCSYSEMKSTNRRVATTKGAECACSLHSHTSEIY
jgi:hypothetical protein